MFVNRKMSENYLNNKNLKNSGVPIEYTREQVQEYVKCAKNPEYFVEEYVKIINVDKGLVPFHMYDYQKKMVDEFHNNRFVICKLPRQAGKSVTVTGYLLWVILFNDSQSVAILANKERLAIELLGKIRLAYEYLPKWLQQGILEWNKGSILLENQSKIVAAATSSSAIRGGSYNIVFLDEFAFIGDNIAEEFFASVYPTISSGKSTKIFVVSTPKGLNHFYKLYTDATQKRNEYVPIEVHWSDIPGRDEKWKEQTIANTSEEQFRQEFECEFIGSSNTLIAPTKLRNIPFINPIFDNGSIQVYERAEKEHQYCIVVDVARGNMGDYSAFVIVDISTIPYKVVGKYKNNTISPLLFPEIIYNTAKSYNDSYVLIEINDIGGQVADILHNDLEYDNLLMSSIKGRAGQRIGGGFGANVVKGVRTTKQVKSIGCSNLKDMIETDKLIVNDFDILTELSNFVSRRNSYEADGGHDDLVMCLVLFCWLAKQEYFKDLTNTDFRTQFLQEKNQFIEDNVLPFGFIDDGIEPDVNVVKEDSDWLKL